MFGLAWAAERYGNDWIADRMMQGFHVYLRDPLYGSVCVLVGGYW